MQFRLPPKKLNSQSLQCPNTDSRQKSFFISGSAAMQQRTLAIPLPQNRQLIKHTISIHKRAATSKNEIEDSRIVQKTHRKAALGLHRLVNLPATETFSMLHDYTNTSRTNMDYRAKRTSPPSWAHPYSWNWIGWDRGAHIPVAPGCQWLPQHPPPCSRINYPHPIWRCWWCPPSGPLWKGQ